MGKRDKGLSLSTETVRELNDQDGLEEASGGFQPNTVTCPSNPCSVTIPVICTCIICIH